MEALWGSGRRRGRRTPTRAAAVVVVVMMVQQIGRGEVGRTERSGERGKKKPREARSRIRMPVQIVRTFLAVLCHALAMAAGAKPDRFEMRVPPDWREGVAEKADPLGLSVAQYVLLCVEVVAGGEVVPTAWLEEAVGLIEEAQGELKSARPRRDVAKGLDDAVHCLRAARDHEFPEALVWAR